MSDMSNRIDKLETAISDLVSSDLQQGQGHHQHQLQRSTNQDGQTSQRLDRSGTEKGSSDNSEDADQTGSTVKG